MSKQVEVPPELVDKAETFLDRAAEQRTRTLLQDRRPGEPVQTISHRSVAEEITSLAYKHFSNRLLSDKAIHTLYDFLPSPLGDDDAGPSDDEAAALRRAVQEALQATSTPEVDRGAEMKERIESRTESEACKRGDHGHCVYWICAQRCCCSCHETPWVDLDEQVDGVDRG